MVTASGCILFGGRISGEIIDAVKVWLPCLNATFPILMQGKHYYHIQWYGVIQIHTSNIHMRDAYSDLATDVVDAQCLVKLYIRPPGELSSPQFRHGLAAGTIENPSTPPW